jgi:hypothetical protein
MNLYLAYGFGSSALVKGLERETRRTGASRATRPFVSDKATLGTRHSAYVIKETQL